MIKGRGFNNNYKSDIDDLNNIIKRHPSVEQYFSKISDHHSIYKSSLNIFQPIDPSCNGLKSKYTDIRNTLYDLYFDREQSNFCCYCGKNEPDRLDHFRPKSLTPQFSLYRLNLIRCCTPCNEKKGDKCPIMEINLRHPYVHIIYHRHELLFDVVCQNVLLNTEGKFIFDVAVIPNSKLSRKVYKQVKDVLCSLKIANRVSERVSLRLLSIYRNHEVYGKTIADRKKAFSTLAKSSKKKGEYTEYFCFKILSSIKILKQLI